MAGAVCYRKPVITAVATVVTTVEKEFTGRLYCLFKRMSTVSKACQQPVKHVSAKGLSRYTPFSYMSLILPL
jgi:hypothetical protein